MKQTIFVSSVQKELAAERQPVRDFVRNAPVLRRFFDVFLFEDLPAADRRADEVYLSQVNQCGIYLGLLGNEYGYENAEGMSPTEREFDRATVAGKTRLIFVKGSDDKARHPKMAALVRKAGDQLIRRRFTGVPDLLTAVHASLADHLELHGMVQTRPFEERPCRDARVDDIDPGAVTTFLRRAHNERQFPLAEGTPVANVLTHLHLLVDDRLSNAAILLFGRDPQKFIPCAEMRCMHFHGTEIQRPVPFYRIFKGNLFEQVDEAVDFVLSKVNRSVGTRAEGTRAPVRYELPENVVSEAVVNAVVHRDYTSSSAIQVSVFSDRVEVWNPGELLPPLTAASLRKPHRSILRNTRIAEALYLAHYIEKYGTGTLMMIRESLEHKLPEPGFGQEPGEFGITVWRDWLTEEMMDEFGLTERQRQIVATVKAVGRVANTEVQDRVGVSKRTAHRELSHLVRKGLLTQVGTTGKGTFYALRKGAIKGPKGPTESRSMDDSNLAKGAIKGPKGRLLQNPSTAKGARASCPCFMGGTPMPQGVLQEPQGSLGFIAESATNRTSATGRIGSQMAQMTHGPRQEGSHTPAGKWAKIGPNGPRASAGEPRRKSAKDLTANGLKPSRKARLPDRGCHAQDPSRGQLEAHEAVTDPFDRPSHRPSRPTQSTDPVSRLLAVLRPAALSPDALRQAVGIKHRPTFRANYLHPALEAGLIEPTVPDRPNSRLQKYRLTPKGRERMKVEG